MQLLLQLKSSNHCILQVCTCSLRYPPCNVHAPYCHLRPTRFYHIFLTCLIKGKIFKKNIEYKTRVLIFSKTLSETFLVLRRSERYVIKNAYVLHVNNPLILTDFNDN